MRKLQDVLEEQAKAELDDRPERSRTDARRERKAEQDALLTLARALSELTNKQFARLSLDEDLAEAVGAARCMPSHTAKNRQLRVIRRLLKGRAWLELSRQVELVLNPIRRAAPKPPADPNVEALLSGGDAAIDAAIVAHPKADRVRLRQLVRNHNKAPEELRSRTLAKLMAYLRELPRDS